MIYKGSCHCRRVQFEVDGDLREVTECNCSICSRSAYLHWYIQPAQLRLVSGKISITTYWGRGMAGGHHFCPTCGVAVLRTSLEFPPPLSVNARCLDGVDLSSVKVRHVDGKSFT